MAFQWSIAGTLSKRKHRGSKGDRQVQTQRQAERRRLARVAARAAAGRLKSKGGRPPGPQKRRCSKSSMIKRPQCQKAAWMIRRRLRGKQTPMAVTAFARAASEAIEQAKAAKQDATVALEQAKKAANESIEAAKAAKQDATVAQEQTKKAEARLADAIDYADRLRSRVRSDVRVPTFLG